MRIRRQGQRLALVLCPVAFAVCYAGPAQAQDAATPATVMQSNADSAAEPTKGPYSPHARVRTNAAVLYNPCNGEHVDIEQLNSLGFDTTMPEFADTMTGATNPLRRKMLCRNFTYRAVSFPNFTFDVRQPPTTDAGQVYSGQLPTWAVGGGISMVADLKDLHLPGYQLTLTMVAGRANWVWAMPDTAKMLEVVLYKPFFNARLAFRAGYEHTEGEFIGMQVGGNASSGSQGVYAVLPYEVGLSYPPLTSPVLIARVQPVGNFYLKGGVQRSISPDGELVDLKRDPTGFRFMPKGDGVLIISEAGYSRSSAAGKPEFWLRGGYLENTTHYPNLRTNTHTRGNYCAFFLADRQFTQHDHDNPDHGLYAGISAMTAPESMNAYSRYYELRIYQNAPFRRRPKDLTSIVASYTNHSPYTVRELLTEGKTAAVRTGTITGSYSMRIARGTYVSTGISYNLRPAITPRSQGAVLFIVSGALFF